MRSLFTGWLPRAVAAGLIISAASLGSAQSPPGMPAAPLAGGQAAIGGGAYMDAHGNPIVMPASYGEPGGGCYGGMAGADCYGGMGGDPGAAYVDFGGYGPDQCGPYYFDVAVDTVFLTPTDFFIDVPDLASVTALGPTIMSPEGDNDDYEAGWQIAVRYDLGPLSVLEGTYMGLYDIGFTDRRDSLTETDIFFGVPQQDQLNSVFSGYGATPILGLDAGDVYTADYQSDLQSTEFSYRRYWLGHSSRISGTYLAGFRYLRMTEDFNFDTITDVLSGTPNFGNLFWGSENDLVGFQLGGDAAFCLLQGLRLNTEGKAGIYNNRWKFRHSTALPDPSFDNVDFGTDGNQVAFAGEGKAELVCDILPSWSIRGGYRVLYMSSLVTVGNNIDPADVASTAVFTQADGLYHGFHGGVEYIW
jgi:hypothetical protein